MLLVPPAIVIDRIAFDSSASHRHRVVEAPCRLPPSICSSIPPKHPRNKEGRPVKKDDLCISARILASILGSSASVRRSRRQCRVFLDLCGACSRTAGPAITDSTLLATIVHGGNWRGLNDRYGSETDIIRLSTGIRFALDIGHREGREASSASTRTEAPHLARPPQTFPEKAGRKVPALCRPCKGVKDLFARSGEHMPGTISAPHYAGPDVMLRHLESRPERSMVHRTDQQQWALVVDVALQPAHKFWRQLCIKRSFRRFQLPASKARHPRSPSSRK
jgi:hypothetical protein